MPRETRNVTSPPAGFGDRATGSRSSVNGIFRKEGEYWTVGYRKSPFGSRTQRGSPTSPICSVIPGLNSMCSISRVELQARSKMTKPVSPPTAAARGSGSRKGWHSCQQSG